MFWGDFHRLAGLWSMGFVALIAITATWFLVQAVLSDHHIEFPDPPASTLMTDNDVPQTPAGSYPQPLSPDQAIHLVSKRIPGFQPGYINLPRHAYDYLDIGGQGKVPFIYQSVSMNPYTGAIAISRLMRDRPPLEVLAKMMRPLHTGDFGGLWIKLIWCFFGILLSLMVLSGLLIWSKRTVKATASLLNRSALRRPSIAPPPRIGRNPMTHSVPSNASGRPLSTLRQAWRTYRVHLNVLLILIPVAFIPTYFSDFANRVDGRADG
ncbi:PepSY-associated TM helix domain-containing protein [Pseudomonas sp. RC10]|uniref:PepSY-associated TM helix domain-containing protein n=1 Tax=Pseudomonas bambusae TaxID=3139142 RepID=UPI00313A3FDE